MVAIDLMCDDQEQAQGKLSGVKSLLFNADFFQPTRKSGRKLTRANRLNSKDEKIAASPVLYKSNFEIPDFFNHLQNKCKCYPCTQPLIPMLVCKYFNLTGVCLHQHGQKDEARTYFEGALTCMKKTLKRLQDSEKRMFLMLNSTKDYCFEAMFDALQWQVECFGQEGDFEKCSTILQEQKQLLLDFPHQVITGCN